MDPQGRELKPRMQGADVLQLQKDLRTLGATISDREGFFGRATRQAVRTFQGAHGLPGTGVVDLSVRQQINAALASAPTHPTTPGQPPPGTPEPVPVPQSPGEGEHYVVEGEVVQPDGTALRGYRVAAFDRAICQWRPLGTNETNAAGRYRITYSTEQLKAWGKTRADLKVEVHGRQGHGVGVLRDLVAERLDPEGGSDPSGDVKLAESPLILQALPREIVNFAIGKDLYRGPDEFTRVETALGPHLQAKDDLSCLRVPDVLILAREARLPNSSVAHYVKARRWSADLDAPTALFYGLMRRNQPVRLDALLARPLSRLWTALEEARSQNIINLPLSAALRSRLSEIQQRYLARPGHPHAKLLATTTLTAALRATFTQELTATNLTGDAFWESLESNRGFSPAHVTDLRQTYELQALTDDNTSLTTHLRSGLNVRIPRDVAAFDLNRWRDEVLTGEGVEIPDEILPGEPAATRRAGYALMLYRSAEARYPTASLAGQMARSPAWAEQPVSAFFTAFPDFEFGDERITSFLQDHPDATGFFAQAQTGRAELLRVEQLFHLAPPEDKLTVIEPLWNAGLRSAPQIALLGRQHLLRAAGGLDRNVKTGIYRKAVHITSVALNVYMRYHPRLNSLSPYAVQMPTLPERQAVARTATRTSRLSGARAPAALAAAPTSQMPPAQALAGAATTLPEWEALFGSPDACECSHCASTTGPGAYLVDVLAFLQRATDDAGGNALDELLDRRPDIGTLQLTCDNTEIELPQIDLMLEILEAIAASADHKTLSGTAIGATTWDSAHLAAQPEYFDPRAYDIVRAAVYPFHRLPFDLWVEEGRRYLKQMGIARDVLMGVMPPRPGVGTLQIATEALGMSALESEIIRTPKRGVGEVAEGWGVDPVNGTLRTQLGTVEALIAQASIDYNALLRLLNTRYVNPERLATVTFAGDPCALEGAVLTRADGTELTAEEFRSFLDRLHRFLRLQQRLGWTEYELDTSLAALGVEDFDANGFLSQLATMHSLRETLDVPPAELCTYWRDLDTYLSEEDEPSQYEAIFLDPSVFPDIHASDSLDLRNDVFALRADRADLAITTSTNAALNRSLAESDGAAPPTYTVQPEYSAYIQSVTRLTAADLLLLAAEVLPKDAGSGHVILNLANVSSLYRVASFVRAVRSSVPDYLRFQRITGMSPLHTSTIEATPLDSHAFHERFREVDEGNWSIEQLAYLLLDESDAAALLAPLPEDMDAWLMAMSPSFVGAQRPATISAELKTTLTQSLGSTLDVDALVLEDLLFVRRPALGADLVRHLIAAANPEGATPPVPDADFHGVFKRLHKFGLAWKGLGLDPTHLSFVLDVGPDLGWTDIASLPVSERPSTNFGAWRRLAAAADLQTSVFTVEQSVFGLMQAAMDGVSNPSAFVLGDFQAQISEWSSWPLPDVVYFTGPGGFNLTLPDAMQDERPFVALRDAFVLLKPTGVSAEQAHAWTSAELTFESTQSIKQALTLSYEPDSWLEVLGSIQDELRTLRRDALLAYLLHTLGFEDSTAFYHHYLIDPLYAPCARTSRIVEMHAAVQTFAQRILFNLESFTFSAEDAEAWQWRKNYRVWEAARKVFLFPQNWLQPELRDNKSVFFKELEDGLSQDDITLPTAERLYREYLLKLDQVSRLEIMGMYEDTWVSGETETTTLHVLGRTRDVPHLYYYRRCEDRAFWKPWERVPLDIQGDHLTPIVYNGRLYLFWPTFTLTPIEPDVATLDEEIEELNHLIQEYDDLIADYEGRIAAATDPLIEIPALELGIFAFEQFKDDAEDQKSVKVGERRDIIKTTPANDVEVGMSWSTYADGRWSPKRLAASGSPAVATNFRPMDFYFTGWVTSSNNLYVAVRGERMVESEVEPAGDVLSDLPNGPLLETDDVSTPELVAEPLDVGYFSFDDCQSALLFTPDTDMSTSFGVLTSASTLSSRFAALGGSFEAFIPVVAPSGDVKVTESVQSFDSRKLTGTVLSFDVGANDPELRLLLEASSPDDKVNYAHQYGRGGELSPFFYSDSHRTYFVQPDPDALIQAQWDARPLESLPTTATGRSARVGAIASATPNASGLLTTTHYQQASTTQIIDRGSAGVLVGATVQNVADLGVIVASDPPPTILVGTGIVVATGLRYPFTRFYHPYTCPFLTQLSRYGVEGLLNPDPDRDDASKDLYRQLTPLETFDFESTYGPNSAWVSANYNAEGTDEAIDFDHDSPYGLFNWELFFHIPLLVASRLVQNQRFDEARRWFHYIFDPRHKDGEGPSRFWKIKPFYEAQLGGPTDTLQQLLDLLEAGSISLEQQVQAWEKDPFRPDAIARLRVTAYMQATVRMYLDCLIRQADLLFISDTRENINEAKQLYLLAAEILGERPTVLPAQDPPVLTPNELLGRYSTMLGPGLAFDPLDILTSILPTSLAGVASTHSGFRTAPPSGIGDPQTVQNAGTLTQGTLTTTSAAGGTETFNTLFLFCLPQNDMLYGCWDVVEDRLFKVRHCMNLSGQVRQLALFAPPIDPALLIRATAAGLDLSAVISGLYESLPNYRFTFMLAKALELCGDVRNFGGALLAALEKKDGEELSRLRSTHEISLLGSIRSLKQKAVEEADAALAGLLESKQSAELRAAYYSSLEKVSSGEQKSLDGQEDSRHRQRDAEIAETTASVLHTIPTLSFGFNGPIPAQQTAFGGPHLGAAAQAFANTFRARSAFFAYEANKAGTMAGYERRLKDWRLQADLAKKEIDQLEKQILAAEIRKQMAETDLENQAKQTTQAEEIEEFLKMKFTSQELYSYMLTKLSAVHFQAYQIAFQMAKQAEKAYLHELGPGEAADTFVQLTNWDSLKKGLMSGELLQLDLRRMEKAYLDANRRDLEITKPVSLFQLDPSALLDLRQTGACDIHIPEAAYALDFPGHYFRRIKAIRITIPGVAGPHTSVSATLSLTRSWTRREVPADLTAAPEADVTTLPQTAIATCTGNADSGLFELTFNDARYLPFEGAGAISSWHLELPLTLRAFDYSTISDVVMHVSYTARDGGAVFKEMVSAGLPAALNDWQPLVSSGVTQSRLFSLRHDFPDEWHALTRLTEGQTQSVTLTMGKQHFPRYLDFVWSNNGSGPVAQPISLSFSGASPDVILAPNGVPPEEADTPVIAVAGLSDISNDEGADVVISVSGVLDADRWRDLYLLLRYEVVA